MFLRKVIYFAAFALFILSVLGYGFYKALPLILGPKIELSTPENGQIVEGTTIPIRGTIIRAQKLYINGIATAFSNTGFFETRIAVYPGNNILELVAEDKFSRSQKYTLNIGTK